MSADSKIPPPRNLDIYRLVVVRGLKQTEVAELFCVSPVRICQIVSRVRCWVDSTIGEWLFPRRDDLRFYVALEAAQVRVHELENEPENVLLAGLGWTYSRQVTPADKPSTTGDVNDALPLSAAPLNSVPTAAEESIATTASTTIDCVPTHLEQLGRRLAELLIPWQKSRRLTGAFKSAFKSCSH